MTTKTTMETPNSNKPEWSVVQELWNEYSQRSQQHIIQGNDIIVGTSKLLLSGGAFTYLITSNIFDIRNLSNPYQQSLLIASWLFIFVSFYAGIRHLINESSFSGNASKRYSKATAYIKNHYDTESTQKIIDKTNDIIGKGIKVSDMHLFWLQAWLLFLALLTQLGLSIWILLS